MEQNTIQLFRWAKELQNMAAAGIQYTTNDFDRERFLRIRDIAAEMAAYELDLPPAQLKDAFALDLGYQTPKIETRAAIFDDDRVLLVRERNGKWSMPGGWCDEGETIRSNTKKEAWEESGLSVDPYRIVALDSQQKRNRPANFYGVCKVFVLCRVLGGEEKEAVKAQISDISKRLGEIRKEVRLCEGIAARSGTLKEKLQTVRADEQEIKRKELMKNEHRRRCGGTNREDELRGI